MLSKWFKARPEPEVPLYEAIVAAARQPVYYLEHGVADTLDGRFDMLTLHMFLVLERLRSAGPEYDDLRQQLTDRFFADMDRALREMGVGDISVGKKVRKMSESFFGRVTAYQTAVMHGAEHLAAVLARNVYADSETHHATGLAEIVMAQRESLARQSASAIQNGEIVF